MDNNKGIEIEDGENKIVSKNGAFFTSLVLMGYGIKFCKALANTDFAYMEANLADKISGFGTLGKVW